MADPLSITASIIAVLQLTTTVTGYLKDAQGGSDERLRLRDEIRNTVCVLEMLKDRAEEAELQDKWAQSLRSLNSQNGPLTQFSETLELLVSKLAPKDRLRQIVQTLKWPLDKTEFVSVLNSLERQKTLFTLALQCDHIQLSQEINVNVESISECVGQLQSIHEIQRSKETLQEIVSWLSPLDSLAKHLDVRVQRHNGTCQWFSHSDTFREWLSGRNQNILCQGIPGAGKTVIASAVIDHLEDLPRNENIATVYLYCEYKQVAEQTIGNFLGSILAQLMQQGKVDVVAFHSTYHQSKYSRAQLSSTELSSIIIAAANRLSKLHIVIDALDECDEATRQKLISEIKKFPSHTHTLVTSRFSPETETLLNTSLKLEIRAQDMDLQSYIKDRAVQEPRLAKHIQKDPFLLSDITEAIIENAKGMFLLARFHFESLATKQNRKAIRMALARLPKELDETYKEAIQRIDGQNDDDALLGRRVLSWISFAERAMTASELRHALAVGDLEPEETILDEEALTEEDLLVTVCAGIVIIDKESQIIRLIHYSAQEYFNRHRNALFPDAKISLANDCLRYLTLEHFSGGSVPNDGEMQRRIQEYPFFLYASSFWGSHARQAPESNCVEHINRFFDNENIIQATIQAGSVPGHRYYDWSQRYPQDVPSLVYAASFGLSRTVSHFILKRHDIEGRGSDSQTALMIAARNGHEDTVTQLLHENASQDARSIGGETSLILAANNGHELVVSKLITAGSDTSIRARDGWTALIAASFHGHDRIVALLLAAGAEVDIPSEDGSTALIWATKGGHTSVVNKLLAAGANASLKNSTGRNATTIARIKGNKEVVDVLTAWNTSTIETPGFIPTIQRDETLHSQGQIENSEEPGEDGVDAEIEIAMKSLTTHASFREQYAIIEKIGQGHYAPVYLCLDKARGFRYAAKTYQKPAKGALKGQLLQEIKVILALQHPNILNFIDFIDEDERIYLVLELAPEGELFNWIVTNQKATEPVGKAIHRQLMNGVQYLHSLRIIHLDIKPENILISAIINGTPSIKLADFGLSTKIDAAHDDLSLNTLCGTPSYVAPEILESEENRRYGFGADIWSSGVVLYILLCGFPPFSEELCTAENPYTLSQQIKMGRFDYPSPYWDSVGDPALDLIDRMLTVDVKKRYTVEKCLRHIWANDQVSEDDRMSDLLGN